jgi:acetyl-CoA carboxylase biotin carboxyl carrier protein
MDGNQGPSRAQRHTGSSLSQQEEQSLAEEGDVASPVMSIEQLRRLVRLLDRSDVFELELKRGGAGTRLLLRKAGEWGQPAAALANGAAAGLAANEPQEPPAPALPPAETRHFISAHLVGYFHVWSRPRGGAIVAVGDRIKKGQLVATIQSLNVINEVESTVAGRVVEILAQDGQPVEYGQHLMVIVSSEGA